MRAIDSRVHVHCICALLASIFVMPNGTTGSFMNVFSYAVYSTCIMFFTLYTVCLHKSIVAIVICNNNIY